MVAVISQELPSPERVARLRRILQDETNDPMIRIQAGEMIQRLQGVTLGGEAMLDVVQQALLAFQRESPQMHPEVVATLLLGISRARANL